MMKALALYLPQFHRSEHNDRWISPGFTEWDLVRRAKPLFANHRQPREPSDLGYYDLLEPGVMESQASLAREYGIHGFAVYYYRANGERMLWKPVERMLGDWDFPFCLVWGNHDWVVSLLEWKLDTPGKVLTQTYEDIEEVAGDFVRHFRHPAYIRHNGRPLLFIYQSLHIPAEALDRIRKKSVELGDENPYIVGMESLTAAGESQLIIQHGYDATVQFPPHGGQHPIHIDPQGFVVMDSHYLVDHFKNRFQPGVVTYPGIMPGWDNTPRRVNKAHVFSEISPEMYEDWLRDISWAEYVLINAWNEWGEGAYLEPDTHFGREYLEATRRAIGT